MSNKISDSRLEIHTHTRTIRFDGVDPQPVVGFSYRGKQYIPEWAVATWGHGKRITEIKVTGAVLKNDGTPGERPVTVEYGKSWRADAEVPEWLLELFADSPHTTTEATK